MKRLAVIALVMGMAAYGNVWMNPSTAKNYLERRGYTEVQTLGSEAMKCGQNGPGAVGFSAKDPKGVKVTGAVCENYGGGFVVITD